MPDSCLHSGQERESDKYYKLDLARFEPKSDLRRMIRKAAEGLTVERSRQFTGEHHALLEEFLKGETLAPRVRELFLRMADYVPYSQTSLVLDARDARQQLSAFYVVEMGARDFATYVVGGYSRRNQVPHASDLLFWEMTNLAKEQKKEYIHLGLGVNEGIRRFKAKWGGIPFLNYEFAEYLRERPGPLSWLRLLGLRF
ncbi:MAG: hypothetical protein NTY64_18405 [Deltaproteobacteria bacterium]|nr:hypothetical protein [Deltaproteobacteria bacterium]